MTPVIDAASLLWTDSAFGASRDTAERRFADVRRVVANRDGADEFLDLAAKIEGKPDSAELWAEPRAYWWAATAERLLPEPARLARHLTRFQAMVLDARAAVADAPMARGPGYEVVVSPLPFDIPEWAFAEPALTAGVAYHEEHVALVEQTLGTVDRFAPDTFRAFTRIIRAIGLKPRSAGGYDDFSNPELPGTFIASVRPNPLVLADHFVHELQHNRLSFVEELGPLFDDSRVSGRYYSPWREDARSLYGVFHGVYVFLVVHAYWTNVHEAELGGDAGAYARDQVVRIPRQLALAVTLLERHAPLTPFGTTILTELARAVGEVTGAAEQGERPDAVPAFAPTDDGGFAQQTSRHDGSPVTVGVAIAEHVAGHEAGAQCAGLLLDAR